MNADLLLAHFERISEAPDAVSRLRSFILDLAVRGKLVCEQFNGKKTDQSVELAEANAHASEKLDGAVVEVWPYELPLSWKWHRLEEISHQITDGEHATPQRISERQVPLVTAKNVRDGSMDYDDTDWVSLETAGKAWRRCRPIPGDILLVCVGATTGRLCILREPKDMVLVRSVALIRPDSSVYVDYLALTLRSPLSQRQIWEKVKVSAQPCLYINRIKSLSIPLPPLYEQRRIVAKVDDLMALCDGLEAAQRERDNCRDRLSAASLHRLNNGVNAEALRSHASFYLQHLPRLTARTLSSQQLRETIRSLAVRGLLLHQDSVDEPSSELLKRIENEKATLMKQGLLRKEKPLSPIAGR